MPLALVAPLDAVGDAVALAVALGSIALVLLWPVRARLPLLPDPREDDVSTPPADDGEVHGGT